MPSTVVVRARWDDCDRNGHVNNAAYAALLRDALARASPDEPPGALVELEIEHRAPLAAEVDVPVAVEIEDAERGLLLARFTLRAGETVAAVARTRWRRDPLAPAPALPPLAHDLGGRPFAFAHDVGPAEVGPDDTVRPVAVLHWLEHAVYRAARLVGWDIARMRAADFVTLQRGHHLVLDARAGVGETLTVTSRLVEMRRVSGTWHHEVRRADGALVAADRSSGAFVDLAGRPRRAPEEMIAALVRGEPA